MKKEQKHDVDFKLKIPILNNMALCFLTLAEIQWDQKIRDANYKSNLERSLNLLDQVLKIDTNNEKALMRKGIVLADLD